jgi:hypothetical protein
MNPNRKPSFSKPILFIGFEKAFCHVHKLWCAWLTDNINHIVF